MPERRAPSEGTGAPAVKRVYEPAAKSDGLRVFVERLWPRGMTKDRAAIDIWLKDIAPSGDLRKWYGHDPRKWNEFKRRYYLELGSKRDVVRTLRDKMRSGKVTLLYASRDEKFNSANALVEYLKRES